MRIPFLSSVVKAPFDSLQEHAETVKECAWAFQQAIECHIWRKCRKTFEEFRAEVSRLEKEADDVKRRIRAQLPKGAWLPVDKFKLFRYVNEQDNVLDAVEASLDWISYRMEAGIPKLLENEVFLLADTTVEPIEELSRLVAEARQYFNKASEKQRNAVNDIILHLRTKKHEADKLADSIKRKIFHTETDAIAVFHSIRLCELINSIAEHAENAGDMMQAMMAK